MAKSSLAQKKTAKTIKQKPVVNFGQSEILARLRKLKKKTGAGARKLCKSDSMLEGISFLWHLLHVTRVTRDTCDTDCHPINSSSQRGLPLGYRGRVSD